MEMEEMRTKEEQNRDSKRGMRKRKVEEKREKRFEHAF